MSTPQDILRTYGLTNLGPVYWNLSASQLIEKAIERGEGVLSAEGALVARTGQFTGRSPKDKFVVRDSLTESTVDWGPVNQPMSPEHFDRIFAKVQAYYQQQEVFVLDALAGADPKYTLPIRVIGRKAWQAGRSAHCRIYFLMWT